MKDQANNPSYPLTQIADKWNTTAYPTFVDLSLFVKQTHDAAQVGAIKAVNQLDTLRNWLIGCYIVEYEQNGQDRAKYGERLLKRLEENVNTRGLNETLFRNARMFYKLYPQVNDLFHIAIAPPSPDTSIINDKNPIHPIVSDEFTLPITQLLENLSFSHICEILTVKEPLARYFYERECILGCWSVKELRRQISTNLYFRCGVSKNPQKILNSINIEKNSPALNIRQPFTFEFLGLDPKEIFNEKDLENALVNHLEEFLLELGKGFCFEARQKRIIIDSEYYFADLIFYHRILHCNIICELKNDEFKHEYLGQLNAYVSYYKENEMHEGDRPPIGILLCTRKGKKMVEYAIAGMDNHLFVSTYMLQLPDKTLLEQFLLEQVNKNNK